MIDVVSIAEIRGAIKEKLIEDGYEDNIENVLSDLERHFSPVDYETEM